MQFTKTAFALLAATMAAAAPAENAPAATNNGAGSPPPPHLDAVGTTYFTADGYYHTDCTGNKYWSYEIAAVPKKGCLSENQEIGSVWIQNYGNCPDGKVMVEQFAADKCAGVPFSTQFTSRGQCMGMTNDGWGAYSVRISCQGIE